MQWGYILTRALGVEGRVNYRYSVFGWAAPLLAGCAGSSLDRSAPFTLDPGEWGALHVPEFWWTMFALGLVVYVGVLSLALWVLFRQRGEGEQAPSADGEEIIISVGLVTPTIVMVVAYMLVLRMLQG